MKIRPIVFGGEQQKNIRSGTENVPGIAGLGLAAKTIYDGLEEKVARMRALKARFIEGVQKLDDITITASTMRPARRILSVLDSPG